MINSTWMLFCLVITVVIFGAGCSKTSPTVMELKHYPIENLEGLIAITDVVIDKEITSDGNGSLRITADQPTTIRLYETGDIDAENARLTYQAKVRNHRLVYRGDSILFKKR